MDKNADSEGTSMLLAMVQDAKCGSKFAKVGDFVQSYNSDVPVSFTFGEKRMVTLFKSISLSTFQHTKINPNLNIDQ